MRYKYIIKKRLFDVSGYPYYVQRLHSLDGKTYGYYGYGKDGKTIADCERWIKEDSAEAEKYGIEVEK